MLLIACSDGISEGAVAFWTAPEVYSDPQKAEHPWGEGPRQYDGRSTSSDPLCPREFWVEGYLANFALKLKIPQLVDTVAAFR